MKELNTELIEEIKGYYKKYKLFQHETNELTRHNRGLKSDFVDINFENEEVEDRKRIKKEITKYFNTIIETDSGTEPVIEVRSLRKDHLDFEPELYDQLMTIYKQVIANGEAKEIIKAKIEKDILIPLCPKLGVSIEVVKGILKTWYDTEEGKFPSTLQVADGYRAIIAQVDNTK